MPKYAQIDLTTGAVQGISFLSGEVIADHMILLTEDQDVDLWDVYVDGVWHPAPTPEPVSAQELKLKELNSACNTAIIAGFSSDAIGTENTYDFDYDAQINLGGMLNAITAGLVTSDIVWKASGIPQTHTVEQFKVVYGAGLTHKNTNIERYWTLKAAVLAATSDEEIRDITW